MTTYQDSFVQASSITDESAIGGAASYLWGILKDRTPTMKPMYTTQIQRIDEAGEWTPVLHAGNHPLDQIQFYFRPVNGIPFYALYGKATHTVANTTQTIVPMTTTEGRKPRYKGLEQIDTQVNQINGIMFTDGTLTYEKGDLYWKMSGKGTSLLTSQSTSTASYPSSKEATFNLFKEITWNGTAILTPMGITMQVTQRPIVHLNSEGVYDLIDETNPIYTGFTMIFAGIESALTSDYYNQTARTLTWTMAQPNDPTKTFVITATNCYIQNLDYKQFIGEYTIGTAVITAGSISIVITDNVNDSFYEV